MTNDRVVFAHGSTSTPRIVSSLTRAKDRAREDAARNRDLEPILIVDLDHPERNAVVLGYVDPEGLFHHAGQ